ncbi:hypothetical protein C1J03_12060 [Sulfitobacter sp. SK012]|uniref:hypothetical protein n=1 Tax=Sulfitobacter sp. SK012 TaxID=1389005 RepID=UPI000E0C7EBA|nr:hypothetical protein [Sulfitobacter sp. SK012]AXI46692.1 hypothetical protein C1J03_12060 [Sulfitobacter sp. SK012]
MQRAVVVASLVHLVLSIVDLVSYELGLPDLLDPLRTAQFLMLDNQQIFGVKRLVGGFPEPSSFSFYTIGLYGYWLRLWFGAKRSRLAGAMLLITSVLLLRSTSTSAYATMGTFTALFVVWHFGAALREKKPMTAFVVLGATLPLVLGVLLAAYGLLPNLRAMIDGMFVTKIASDSGVERLVWNLQALRNFRDTYGFGAGLGSVRASSWLVSCLGSLGLIGTGVFVWFIAAVTTARPNGPHSATAKVETAAALQAGCLAILLQSLITKPYPNLEAPFFAMAGIAVGLLRHVQTTQSATSRSPFFGRNRIKPI